MASRAGRKPAPPALKLVRGDRPGRDSGGRKVEAPPSFVRQAPDPPTWLEAEAKAEWKRVVPELDRLKLLKRPSRSALTSYVRMWATFVDASKEVQEHGLTRLRITTRKSGDVVEEPIPNPAVVIQRDAQRELRQWAAEFGLTPSSEARLHVPDADPNDTADFD